mgnify:FL=1
MFNLKNDNLKPDIFYCYSYPLKEFLVKNGERYFSASIHFKTKKRYWMFKSSERLNQLLSEWRARKPS